MRNYEAWKINHKDFNRLKSDNEKIKFLINYAVLAPSSHNTQPWNFKVVNNKIQVLADFKRRLPVADPTDRELYTSIGCAIANIEIASEFFKLTFKLTLFPKKGNKKLVAEIAFLKSKTKNSQPSKQLFSAIPKRMTNRSLYRNNKKLPKGLSKSMSKLTNAEGVSLHIVENKTTKTKLANLTKEGIKKAFENPAFRKEVSLWLRHNWTKKEDGMPGNTLNIPDAFSILAPAVIRSVGMAKETSLDEKKMVESASAIGIFSIAKDDREHWVKTGIMFEKLALLATSQGVSAAVLSAAVEMKEERLKLKNLLGVKNHPSLFFRLGYPTKKMKHAPRRTADKVIVN